MHVHGHVHVHMHVYVYVYVNVYVNVIHDESKKIQMDFRYYAQKTYKNCKN